MAGGTCRVCNQSFFAEPLLRYTNMPKAAQHLPDLRSLDLDAGVDLAVHQCSGCGLVQLDVDPVAYYREVIRATSVSQVITEDKTRQFRDLIQRFSLHKKKIIEIGCG